MQPKLARQARKHATHAFHVSMPPTPPLLAHHPRKRATHISTNRMPFLKLEWNMAWFF